MEYNLDISAGVQTENPVLQSYLRLPQGKSAFSVFGLSIALDLRDSPFNPTQGFYLAVEGDWVYSLPFIQGSSQDWIEGDPVPIEKESNLIRTQATVSGYIPIFNTDMVFAMSVTIGYIFHLQSNSTTWPDRYYYVGGVDTLRGFPEDALIPEDIYRRWKSMLKSYGNDIDELLNNRGGEAMFVTRIELRYPLAKGFYGAGFGEFGNLWRDRKEMAPFVFSPDFKIQLRPVAGVGLRYQTPLGPIAFDLGVNLHRRPTELPLAWYISIGSAF
jgi:outer membrane protein assembly factor BamA